MFLELKIEKVSTGSVDMILFFLFFPGQCLSLMLVSPIGNDVKIHFGIYFFLNSHPPKRQIKLPNNPKPGVELFLLDSFPLEILPL